MEVLIPISIVVVKGIGTFKCKNEKVIIGSTLPWTNGSIAFRQCWPVHFRQFCSRSHCQTCCHVSPMCHCQTFMCRCTCCCMHCRIGATHTGPSSSDSVDHPTCVTLFFICDLYCSPPLDLCTVTQFWLATTASVVKYVCPITY